MLIVVGDGFAGRNGSAGDAGLDEHGGCAAAHHLAARHAALACNAGE